MLIAKHGSTKEIFAFSVFLGGFDRKILVRPIFIETCFSMKATNSPKKQTGLVKGLPMSQMTTINKEQNDEMLAAENQQARGEVARLPLWALTLKEQGSKDSLPDRPPLERKIVESLPIELAPCSFFHQPFYQPDSLPDRSPLAITLPEPPLKSQPLTSRSKTPTKLRGGGWERPMKSTKGEIIDQPVTFHSRIKSSGYGVADVASNRWKQKRQGESTTSASSSSKPYRSKSAPRNTTGVTDRTTLASRLRMYPRECGSLTQHQEYNNFPPPVSSIRQVPIMRLNFSGDGMMIGVVSAGNDVGTLRTPLGKYKGDGTASFLLSLSPLPHLLSQGSIISVTMLKSTLSSLLTNLIS
jgi:hypothetical protein